MAKQFDPMEVAMMDKTSPLRCTESTRETTCCLCGGPISPMEWVVKIKTREAHPSCAGDHGWAVE